MDLIIELIVWIVKSIAGEGDKNKTANKGATTPPAKRGPYNYGDGGPAAGARPKTLEEILEEVKRQQALLKSGAPRQPVARVAPPPAPVAAKVPTLARPLSEIQQSPSSALPLAVQGGARQPSIETRMIKQSLDQREIVRPGLEQKFEKITDREDQMARGIGHTKMVAEVNAINASADVQSVTNMESNLADKKLNTYAELFKAMRIAAPKARLEMARRAFVYSEVFGPPKALHGRGLGRQSR